MVNMWTHVRHLKELPAVIVQDSHSQSWLAVVKLHHPFVDTDAYVASSNVSLVG